MNADATGPWKAGREGRMMVTGAVHDTEFDMRSLAEELHGLQARLDRLAREGTNPYEIARLQRCLDRARDGLASSRVTSSAPDGEIGEAALARPRQESNLRTRFRKPMLYPLSYGGRAASVTVAFSRSAERSPRRLGHFHQV
jgi:hypothetical protein